MYQKAKLPGQSKTAGISLISNGTFLFSYFKLFLNLYIFIFYVLFFNLYFFKCMK